MKKQVLDSKPQLIVSIRGKGNRYLLELDTGKHLKYHKEAILGLGIDKGTLLDDNLLQKLIKTEEQIEAHESALRLLSYRARSENELIKRLRQKAISEPIIQKEISRLRNSGLVNDTEFAHLWVKERGTGTSARSRRLLSLELRTHGINEEILEEALASADDNSAALQVARKKARQLTDTERKLFQKRLTSALKQKGFEYEVIRNTIEIVWNETN